MKGSLNPQLPDPGSLNSVQDVCISESRCARDTSPVKFLSHDVLKTRRGGLCAHPLADEADD